MDLHDAATDFFLSRQAMQCTSATLAFYRYTLGAFLAWIEGQNVTTAREVTSRHVRQFLAGLEGKSDNTIHDFARAIKTLLRFWHAEKYMPEAVTFAMPRLAKRRLPVLTAEEVRRVLAVCNIRDRAIVALMVDSGIRRAEAVALDWNDVDLASGLVRVRSGKGRKARSSAIGAITRRALLAYRRTLGETGPTTPLLQTAQGTRLTAWGLGLVFRRLTHRTGVHITPHALRRTCAILSLRAGMGALHVQHMLGHEGLEMVQHYAQMVDDDLLQAHTEHGPMDSLGRV